MLKLLSILLLLITAPIFVFISLLIYIESGSRVIFKQARIGLHKKEFIIYKFKTMENNNVTFMGRFLRKLGVDELPQLINIIKGEMNFIGPRPLTKYDIDRLGWDEGKYYKRWETKPGITGVSQLSKVCDAAITMKNDLYYVENRSKVFDLKIIVKTLLIPFIGKPTN
jgi:lipopolysaccharide/colanic/teichoic acid biosynthesis glycosyltransferase